ncbi:MAG: efflux RND transporter permease subunit [Verrucomicrobia bacterium]|nr:efflux RND transporter permease subunit [Verrucomicrobiota bacterium]
MVARIFEFSLRQRALVLMGVVALAVAGAWSAARLPIDAVPDITNVQVQINTAVAALAADEIERQITFPIETEMQGLQGLVELRSISRFGLSQVTLVFDDHADIYRARQLVTERLQNVIGELPRGTQPKLAPITTGLGEVFFYTVDYAPTATNKPPTRYEQLLELRQIQEWIIKPMLRSAPGIAEVNTSGGYVKQIVVLPNPDKMMSAGLSFDELAGVVGENVENAGGGIVQRGGEQITIRSAGRVRTTAEIGNLPIKFGGRVLPLLVKDVAEVGVGSAFRVGASTMNGEEAVVCWVMMLSGANSRVVARQAGEKLKEIQRKLPEGIAVRTVYDRSELVNHTIGTVEKNLFEGAILVAVVLLALIGNWRAALIVAAAIPLSMLFALTGMVRFGISGNLMSLGAVDFGLIVDGAVVIVENVVRQLGLKQHQLGRRLTVEERLHTIRSASNQVGRPMVFAVIIITIVYVPILALTGIEGKMFKPMALTVIFALIGALVLSLTVVPVLCYFCLGGSIKEGDNWLVRAAKRIYEAMLQWALGHRWVVMLVAVALFAVSVFEFRRLGAEFVPQLDEGSTVLMLTGPASVGIDTSLAQQKKAEAALMKEFPEITHIYSRIGTAEVQTDPMGPNLSDTFIFFVPPEKWRKVNGRTITKDDLAEAMSKTIQAKTPGLSPAITQPIEMRFNELLEGARADIAVRVFGQDLAVLEKAQTDACAVLERIPGTGDVEFDAFGKAPVLEITLNRTNMTRYNVHASEVNKIVVAALGGANVGTLIEGNRRFEIVVRMPEERREKLELLDRLPLRTSDGGLIPLGKVANISMTERVSTINREAGQRRAALLVNLRGRDVQSWVNEAQAKLAAEVKLPDGYYFDFGGQFKNLQAARTRLAIVVPLVLALIFILIFAAFGSLRQAFVIYSGIPLAMTGGVFALVTRELPFSISAGVGFIALSGVAVLNGVVLITYFNQLREEGRAVLDAVREGALTRLRPVLMTALVASLGFVPMALATGAGAEVQRPLATVVIGGILSSTFLTLLLLPVLYAWAENKSRPASSNTINTP